MALFLNEEHKAQTVYAAYYGSMVPEACGIGTRVRTCLSD